MGSPARPSRVLATITPSARMRISCRAAARKVELYFVYLLIVYKRIAARLGPGRGGRSPRAWYDARHLKPLSYGRMRAWAHGRIRLPVMRYAANHKQQTRDRIVEAASRGFRARGVDWLGV